MPTSKQRREAERRRLQRQLQRRAQRDARRRRAAVIASVIGTLLVIGIVVAFVIGTSSDSKTTAAKSAAPSSPAGSSPAGSSTGASSSAAPPYPCRWTKSGTAAKPVTVPPTTTPPKTGSADLLVQTTQGPMTFALDRAAAPCAVESFLSLAEQHFFDKTPCHRLTSGGLAVLQCGDPTGTGSGGPGYSFGDELSGKEKYSRGVLAMANSGPNTNGSQFFIVYKDSTLNPNYTIFGKLTSGLPVIDKVAAKGSDPAGDGKPKLPITITSAAVVQ